MPGPYGDVGTNVPLLDRNDFQKTVGEDHVDLFTLHAPGGIVTQITNYGARVVNLFAPDRDGAAGNVVLGFPSFARYQKATDRYYGAIVGRYANRISGGTITLDGITYELSANEGPNLLHGGHRGFDSVVWSARQVDERTLILGYASRHLEEGFPGALSVRVTYTVTHDLALRIEYEATTNAPTVVNLSHHSYFNLAGTGARSIENHALQILADEYTPVGDGLIPTGDIAKVEGTPLDFRAPRRIGECIDDQFDQITLAGGYDHNWVLRPASGPLRAAARAYEPTSGRTMEVLTTEPGLQFYSGNFFDGSDVGMDQQPHDRRCAFALEPQHFPDSPNHDSFPSTVLRPGEVYRSQTVYRFFPTG
jgi:aldose 1-epimerase